MIVILRSHVIVGSAFLLMLIAQQVVRAEDTGIIKGKVVFKGDPEATDPNTGEKKFVRRPIPQAPAKDPKCAKPIGTENVVLSKQTNPITIKNVLVYVKSGIPPQKKFDPPAEPVILDQKDCQYVGHVVALMTNQQLIIRNSDPTGHNTNGKSNLNNPWNVSQPATGNELKLKFENPEEPFQVKCDVHPWMLAYLAVFSHPYFAITGKEGTFELTKLPDGIYTVEAWHETFGKMSTELEVKGGQPVDYDFDFIPK